MHLLALNLCTIESAFNLDAKLETRLHISSGTTIPSQQRPFFNKQQTISLQPSMSKKRPTRATPGQKEAEAAAKGDLVAAQALEKGELKVSETQVQNGQFSEEQPEVWEGYVEWEKYPEKKKIGHGLMKSTKFPPPPGKLRCRKIRQHLISVSDQNSS